MSDVRISLVKKCHSFDNVRCEFLDFSDIIFKERNAILCFYCGNYNRKWTCPPRRPSVDYKTIFKEYNNFLFVQVSVDASEEDARANSTIWLHKLLLDLERILYDSNYPSRLSFIGGSCKLCKGECGTDRCRRPYEARIPLEATGVDIIETLKGTTLEIRFPVDKTLTRTGLIMW